MTYRIASQDAATASPAEGPAVPPVIERRHRPRSVTLRLPLAPPLEQRLLQVYLTLIVVDAAVIVGAFMLATFLYYGSWIDRQVMLQAQLVVVFYWIAAFGKRAYASDAALDAGVGVRRTIVALAVASALVAFLAFYLRSGAYFSRMISLTGTLLAAGGLGIARDQLTRFAIAHCGPTASNRLVIIDGGPPLDLPHSLTLDAREHGLVPDSSDPHALNRLGLFLHNMNRVVVSCAPERRRAWALVLKGANVQGEIVDEEMLELGALGAHREERYAAMVVATGPLRMSNRILKRLLDLSVSITAVMFLAPLLGLVALAIKLEDGGPVLFLQRRLGRGNRFFYIYKFRSMRAADGDCDGNLSTARSDDRVTKVGRFIRASSIDELPQLFNVLRGTMSLVGPRPHALGSQAGAKLFWEIDDRYWQRHSLKPGLTGLAQVRGLRGTTRHEQDLADRLQSDLEYLDGWSIWRDLKILFATLGVMVHRNAY